MGADSSSLSNTERVKESKRSADIPIVPETILNVQSSTTKEKSSREPERKINHIDASSLNSKPAAGSRKVRTVSSKKGGQSSQKLELQVDARSSYVEESQTSNSRGRENKNGPEWTDTASTKEKLGGRPLNRSSGIKVLETQRKTEDSKESTKVAPLPWEDEVLAFKKPKLEK